MTSYRELLTACDRVGLRVGLALYPAGNTVPDPAARRALELRVSKPGSGDALVTASVPTDEAGPTLDRLASTIAADLATLGVNFNPTGGTP